MTEPPWLPRVRARYPEFDALPQYMKETLAHEEGKTSSEPRTLTLEETALRASLTPELLRCHEKWWTAGKGEPDLNDFDHYHDTVAKAVGAEGPIIGRIYCEECGNTRREQALATIKTTPLGRVFQAVLPLRSPKVHPQIAEILEQENAPTKARKKAEASGSFLLDYRPPPSGWAGGPWLENRHLVGCYRHGTAYLSTGQLKRCAKAGELVVRCYPEVG